MDRTARAIFISIVVIVHLGVGYIHRIAHRELHIWLLDWQRNFAVYVIGLVPLIAMALVWTALRRIGYILLSLSMLGALVFGAYFHFVARSADNVRYVPAIEYSWVFIATAVLLAILEAIGCWAGVYSFLHSGLRAR